MLQHAEIGNIDVSLHLEHESNILWLITARSAEGGRAAEVDSRTFGDRSLAERSYEAVSMHFAFEHLKTIIGDQDRFVRLLKILNETLKKEFWFSASVKKKDTATVEKWLLWISAKAEEPETSA